MTNLNDRRVQKTRQILQKAILDLIVEQGFESIKIQDILDKANVGRSTFYAHFQDKGELLHSCFEELHKLLEQHTFSLSQTTQRSTDLEINSDFTLKFLKFAERNCQLFKAMFKQQDLVEPIKNFLFDYFYGSFKKWMAQAKNTSIPVELVTHYFINAFLGAFKWWLDNNMSYSAEEVDKYFKQLAMPTIKNIVLTNGKA